MDDLVRIHENGKLHCYFKNRDSKLTIITSRKKLYPKLVSVIEEFFECCGEKKILAKRNFTSSVGKGVLEIHGEEKKHRQTHYGYVFYHMGERKNIISQIKKKKNPIQINLSYGLFNLYDNYGNHFQDLLKRLQCAANKYVMVVNNTVFTLKITYDEKLILHIYYASN